jgi:hypothetical protein
MTLDDLAKNINAWLTVAPGLGRQEVFGVRIEPATAEVVISLDDDSIRIPIT